MWGLRLRLAGSQARTRNADVPALAARAHAPTLYTPGIRRHVAGALAQGVSIQEIMEVLKLCGALGVDACELGAPMLTEEFANHQKRS
jgi:hypothetical protein